jgi:hypothetical protein
MGMSQLAVGDNNGVQEGHVEKGRGTGRTACGHLRMMDAPTSHWQALANRGIKTSVSSRSGRRAHVEFVASARHNARI